MYQTTNTSIRSVLECLRKLIFELKIQHSKVFANTLLKKLLLRYEVLKLYYYIRLMCVLVNLLL